MNKESAVRRLAAILLSLIMAVTLLPVAEIVGESKAAATSEKEVAGLCTDGIGTPTVPTYESDTWRGSYVWFGKYDKSPIRFRVLAPRTTAYGGTTMLLDCDNILYKAPFDADGESNAVGVTGANVWAYSDLKEGLNGNKFLTAQNGFTAKERAAIAESRIASHALKKAVTQDTPGTVCDWCMCYYDFIGLSGEKVFVLDAEEASNSLYGYSTEYYSKTRTKSGESSDTYWLRSSGDGCTTTGRASGTMSRWGNFEYDRVTVDWGVSPAMNLDLKSVIFSTELSDQEYKLTVVDKDMSVGVSGGITTDATGREISLNYKVTGANDYRTTQLSVLILDKEYKPANTNKAKILYYGKMITPASAGTFPTTGTASFTLPSGLNINGWGSSYYVYMLAEDVNGVHETDYASTPAQLDAPGMVTLSFDLNGGSMGAPANIRKKSGTSVTIPKSSPYRGGYWFMGWSESKTATTATYKSGSVITLTQDTTLYCVWKKASAMTYRVSFDRNGGSGTAPSPMTVTTGTTVTVPKCSTINREGYYFMGWSVTRGGAVAYKSGDTFKVTANVVLYAVWQPRTNTITFKANGGSGTLPATIKVKTGKTATIGKSSMSRTGYWFLGWSTSKTATSAQYKTGSEISVTKDTTLYAVWKKK